MRANETPAISLSGGLDSSTLAIVALDILATMYDHGSYQCRRCLIFNNIPCFLVLHLAAMRRRMLRGSRWQQ